MLYSGVKLGKYREYICIKVDIEGNIYDVKHIWKIKKSDKITPEYNRK